MADLKFTTSRNNEIIIDRISRLYNFKSSSIVPRIAIMYSFQTNKLFDSVNDEPEDSQGKEIREVTLFGEFNNFSNKVIFKTLFNQHYNRKLSDSEFNRLIKLHLDFGLKKLGENILNSNNIGSHYINFLANIINEGLRFTKTASFSTKKSNRIAAFADLIDFTIGRTKDNSPVSIRLNDLNEFDSHHIAVAGMTGSGKTEFIKDILYQISKRSSSKLKYIFFDYKGEGNSNKLKDFLDRTNCQYVSLNEKSFELNPLSFINLSDERQKLYGISSFVDSIDAIVKLGPKQQSSLKAVINIAIENAKEKIYPDFNDINDTLLSYYQENEIKEDSLTAVIGKLSSQIFTNSIDDKKIYEENLYLSLPITLSDSLRQLCVFLTLKYLLEEFCTCDDVVPNDERINPLRYVIVIDEAHVYLKNKNACKILENMLRVVRSKGVVVIMLTQNPADYKTSDFDFASQVKIPICLNINDKDFKTIKSFVGTPKSENKLQNAINELSNGKAVININEPQIVDINMFWKTIKGES